ncbi:sulfite exporter TauE/SafE family protein [Desulfococcaceae bacterium HSG9]|nr:sulfite exporter TauE/SafE family protein [Desulfococcaceae bacterium HSG9]
MMNESHLAFPIGILIATAVSSVGLGGGVLWMPFFLIILKLSPETAVVTSLLIQIAGMGSASQAFARQKRIDYKLALWLLLIAIPGIAVGALIVGKLKPAYMELIIGVLVMTTAFLFVSSNQKYDDLGKARADLAGAWPYLWVSAPASVISGMLSISMSEWLIPMMRSKLALKMSCAIGTCIFIAFGVCLFGALIHLIMGSRPNFETVLWAVPGVIIGGQIGPLITQRIDERLLKEIFIFLLTLIGIHLIYNAY